MSLFFGVNMALGAAEAVVETVLSHKIVTNHVTENVAKGLKAVTGVVLMTQPDPGVRAAGLSFVVSAIDNIVHTKFEAPTQEKSPALLETAPDPLMIMIGKRLLLQSSASLAVFTTPLATVEEAGFTMGRDLGNMSMYALSMFLLARKYK